MAEQFLPPGVPRPDFYVAALGRSGSTMLCNWLTRVPDQLVLIEPSLLHLPNTRLLRIQLANFGMEVSDGEWCAEDSSAAGRFERIMAPRLAGKRWALKEVLCSEHLPAIEALQPGKLLITVRNIFDVALSFFEKHRAQGNLHRFDDRWVESYCLRETTGLLELLGELGRRSLPHAVIRYEEFVRSEAARTQVAAFVQWEPGGGTDMHLHQFERTFEVERHGNEVSSQRRSWKERTLGEDQIALAHMIAEQCEPFQRQFGYCG